MWLRVASMIRQQFERSMTIASVAGLLAACSAVDRTILATENGTSRIFSTSSESASPPNIDLQSLNWQKLAPDQPDDQTRVAIVDSDAKTGATRVALKVQPGETLPVYWEEVPQSYTVLNGTFIAEGIDSAGLPQHVEQGPGTLARVPARMIQRLQAKPGAEGIMLVTVYGEWKPNFVGEPQPAETQRAAN